MSSLNEIQNAGALVRAMRNDLDDLSQYLINAEGSLAHDAADDYSSIKEGQRMLSELKEKYANLQRASAALADRVLDAGNVLCADLETGTHEGNNKAAEEFNKRHHILNRWVGEIVELAEKVDEEATGS